MGEILLEDIEAISLKPRDRIFDTVDHGIVLCAEQRRSILFNTIHMVPSTGARERNGIAANSTEGIDDDFLALRGACREMLSNFARSC